MALQITPAAVASFSDPELATVVAILEERARA